MTPSLLLLSNKFGTLLVKMNPLNLNSSSIDFNFGGVAPSMNHGHLTAGEIRAYEDGEEHGRKAAERRELYLEVSSKLSLSHRIYNPQPPNLSTFPCIRRRHGLSE